MEIAILPHHPQLHAESYKSSLESLAVPLSFLLSFTALDRKPKNSLDFPRTSEILNYLDAELSAEIYDL